MKPGDVVEIRIANTRVRVPLHKDMAATQALADRITARIEEIQAGYGRVSTQEYALRAAFEFAAEMEAMQADQQETIHNLTTRLQRILTRLRDLTLEFTGGD